MLMFSVLYNYIMPIALRSFQSLRRWVEKATASPYTHGKGSANELVALSSHNTTLTAQTVRQQTSCPQAQ